ncbi:MAG TPA: arsenate reductase ArsC [Aggregatilineaceae bacterium]|nr:arsenate reductase ArsC [Aggregatilineaceae bacterium]
MKKRVLILCTGNSARSQMAEGLLRARAGDRFDVFSAGSQPSGQVHPGAITAMGEIGIDISHHTSKSMMDFINETFDYVLTVCDHAAEACPVFPGPAQRVHYNFTDPAKAAPDEQLTVFRRVRDEIAAWLDDLFDIEKFNREKTE